MGSVKTKTIAAVTAVVITLGIGLHFIGTAVIDRMLNERETMEIESSVERANAAIDDQLGYLDRTAGDWATWDDTYEFVVEPSEEFVASNLSGSALHALSVDFMCFRNSSGELVAAISREPGSEEPVPLPDSLGRYLSPDQQHFSAVASGRPTTGVLALPQGAALISARPILRSDQSGPPAGTFIIGTFLGDEHEETISRLVGESVELDPDAADDRAARAALVSSNGPYHTRELSGSEIRIYALRPTLDGSSMLLSITQPRTSMMLVGQSRSVVLAGMLSGALLLIVTLFIALDYVVLRRLARLGADVRSVAGANDEERHVEILGADEIASLSHEINEMLSSMYDSRREAKYLAEHDALTGLGNRRRFERELERELAAAKRQNRPLAVLWFDLDRFKDINDTYGHSAGDALLALVGETLRASSRHIDFVARIGGDEFAMIIADCDEEQAVAAADRIASAIREAPYALAGRIVHVHTSVGVAVCPAHARTAAELLICADLAMYHAKAAGGSRSHLCSPESQEKLTRRIQWSERIMAALREDRFVLYAMPTRRIADGEPGSWELLLRMIGDQGELIPPAEFLAVAEGTGLMHELDFWVCGNAIELLRRESEAGRSTRFAVNVSAAGMMSKSLPGFIESELHRKGVDPSRLTIEITETSAIVDMEMARSFIKRLRGVGCRFALDDFGSGMASFHYLKHLPVDSLKIDGELIRGLTSDGGDWYFVRAIVEMCHGLGIETVAEYVEDEELLRTLESLGVDSAQGYAIGRPIPADLIGSDEQVPMSA